MIERSPTAKGSVVKEIWIRPAEASDHAFVISVVNEWWGGRNMADMLPKLFFVHFRPTSFVAEYRGKVVGFMIGFPSQTFPDEMYIHFVGVDPNFRKIGLGRLLYEKFFEASFRSGRNVVRCVTSPINGGSIAFHLRMGFVLERHQDVPGEMPAIKDYDGRGEDRILFYKVLERNSRDKMEVRDNVGE